MSLNKQRLTKSFSIKHLEHNDLLYARLFYYGQTVIFFPKRCTSEIREALTAKSDYLPIQKYAPGVFCEAKIQNCYYHNIYVGHSTVLFDITKQYLITINITTYVFVFLGAYEKLRKETISFVKPVCPSVPLSVRPHGTTRLPLDEFS
jgi:hypothetical protein